MDTEQKDMQFLGVFGIYAEACKIISSRKKIFTQITLAFLLPAKILSLAQILISHILIDKLMHMTDITVRSVLPTFILLSVVYLISSVILSIFYYSTIVYTVACAYTSRDITFREVMTIVPKVWKRFILTYLSIFLAMIAYCFVGAIVLFVKEYLIRNVSSLHLAIFVVFAVGLFYMTIIWCLAYVVSVLEDACGFSAMKKSKKLLKGKMLVTIFTLLKLSSLSYVVQIFFEKMVVMGGSVNVGGRVAYGILCCFLLVVLMLFEYVVQTVIYFVCKSYHHEIIDESALLDHVQYNFGDYVGLKAKDGQEFKV